MLDNLKLEQELKNHELIKSFDKFLMCQTDVGIGEKFSIKYMK